MGIKQNNPGCGCCGGCPCPVECAGSTNIVFEVTSMDSRIYNLPNTLQSFNGQPNSATILSGLTTFNSSAIPKILNKVDGCTLRFTRVISTQVQNSFGIATVDTTLTITATYQESTRDYLVTALVTAVKDGIEYGFVALKASSVKCNVVVMQLDSDYDQNLSPGEYGVIVEVFNNPDNKCEACFPCEENAKIPDKLTLVLSGNPYQLLIPTGCRNPIGAITGDAVCDANLVQRGSDHYGFFRYKINGFDIVNATYEVEGELEVDINGYCNFSGATIYESTAVLQCAETVEAANINGQIFFNSFCPVTWHDVPWYGSMPITITVRYDFTGFSVEIYSVDEDLVIFSAGATYYDLVFGPEVRIYCQENSGTVPVQLVQPILEFSFAPCEAITDPYCSIAADFDISYTSTPGYPPDPWLLEGGVWNDAGVWDDNEVWPND